MRKVRIVQQGFAGTAWFAGWLFCLVLAIVLWPYFLGATFGLAHP